MEKSVVIDFDNTIGYFNQIIYILNIIEKTYFRKVNQEDINYVLGNFTKTFRPKIFEIFSLIKSFISKNKIKHFILYTKNKNECFVNMVIAFLEYQLKCDKGSLFTKVIFAKNDVKDFQTIYKFIQQFENRKMICIIDNKDYHYDTSNNTTMFYIKCDTYRHYYSINEIIGIIDKRKYAKLSDNLIRKYLNKIYQKTKMRQNIPLKIHMFNSTYMINLLIKFCS